MDTRYLGIFTIEDAVREIGMAAKNTTIGLTELGNAILDFGFVCTDFGEDVAGTHSASPTAPFYTYEEFMNGT